MKNRETLIQEIKEFVNNQGTLIQDDIFEQVIVHHLITPLIIKNTNILYIGADAIYANDGAKFLFSDLSDDEINMMYIFIIS